MLSQAQLLIDLTTNYDASFVINGVTIPDDQLQKRPELNQVIFNPGPGKVVEKFPAGRNCVEADIFRIDGVQEDVPPPAGASTSRSCPFAFGSFEARGARLSPLAFRSSRLPADALARRAIPVVRRSQQSHERFFVEDGDAELLRFRELRRAGGLADDHRGRLLRHAAGRLAAVRFDRLFDGVAREPFERSGHDDRQAGQRLRKR